MSRAAHRRRLVGDVEAGLACLVDDSGLTLPLEGERIRGSGLRVSRGRRGWTISRVNTASRERGPGAGRGVSRGAREDRLKGAGSGAECDAGKRLSAAVRKRGGLAVSRGFRWNQDRAGWLAAWAGRAGKKEEGQSPSIRRLLDGSCGGGSGGTEQRSGRRCGSRLDRW